MVPVKDMAEVKGRVGTTEFDIKSEGLELTFVGPELDDVECIDTFGGRKVRV